MTTAVLTRTKWPRKVRELILDSDPWSQGVKGWAYRVSGQGSLKVQKMEFFIKLIFEV